ncbi:Hypothetical predicted protein [Lecanosticta acicola]|uniref:Uncharacterized protein n=1 Tax=Lecanosticta acicola TaxID=111012 RepID=A0AAI8YU96_9PEZI|nr:Hypothetical predicted protein [Lecanosticta acicola]
MGRGGAIYLSYTALVLLCAVSETSAGLWDVDIDNGPAPSPEDGPPFSAHASRDRALLPYQIIGVVASYLGTVLIVGTLLFTVGRRARRHALTMADKPTEMIKPMARAFDESVKSPASQRSLRNIFKSKSGSVRSKASNIGSPGGASVASFDQEAVKQHQQRLNEDMANIYGQVYAYDESKEPQSVTSEIQPASPQYARASEGRNALQRVQSTDSYPQSPMTPMSPSYQAIYPPAELRTLPQYPLSPTRGNYTSPQLSPGLPRSPIRPSRTASFGSTNTTGSYKSSPSKARKALNKLEISLPIQKRKDDDNSDGARTPLSPRFYADPGIPPEPPTARTMGSDYPPTTPGTGRTIPYPEDRDYEDEERDQVRAFPPQSPQRRNHYHNLPQIVTDVASTRPDPTKTTPQNRRGNATNLGGTLAFRAQREQQRAYPMSPGRYPQSAGPTKTTFVEARREFLGMPLTATGKEPYSPYMLRYDAPTPVTPHMLTRDERKQRQKEERATKGAAIEEEDLVADEKDLWSSGY